MSKLFLKIKIIIQKKYYNINKKNNYNLKFN